MSEQENNKRPKDGRGRGMGPGLGMGMRDGTGPRRYQALGREDETGPLGGTPDCKKYNKKDIRY
jgi:hypothetical protein